MRGAVLLSLLVWLAACAMVHEWKSIPPPGGCDRCHQLPIAADWRAVLTSADVPRPEERLPWQRPELPPGAAEAPGQQSVDEACFRCHRSPDLKHGDYHGRYHSQR